MDKQKIKTAYDDYVDATVALFVECYSEACAERIHEEMTACSEENVAFPAALDKRCRELIKKENAKRRRKQMWKTAKRVTQSAAIVVLVMLALASVLFATVEAVRIPIINYFIEQSDGYWRISTQKDTDKQLSPDSIDLCNPLSGIIPECYTLKFIDGTSFATLTAIYEDTNGRFINFSAQPLESSVILDFENSQVSQKCSIKGHDAILVSKDGTFRVAWIHEDISVVFTLVADDMTELDVVRIVEQFIEKVS